MGDAGDDVTRPVDLADAVGRRSGRRGKTPPIATVEDRRAGRGPRSRCVRESGRRDRGRATTTPRPRRSTRSHRTSRSATRTWWCSPRPSTSTARAAPIPASVVTTLGAIPGVKAAEGVLRRSSPLRDADGQDARSRPDHDRALLERHRRARPARGSPAGEDGRSRDRRRHPGRARARTSATRSRPRAERPGYSDGTKTAPAVSPQPVTIVGSFSVAGGDAGVPGVALSAIRRGHAPRSDDRPAPGFDRVDLILDRGADPRRGLGGRRGCAAAGLQVVPASELGSREQLRAELEIQRAFYDMLSEDEATRNAAGEFDQSPEARAAGNATFERYLSQLRERRVPGAAGELPRRRPRHPGVHDLLRGLTVTGADPAVRRPRGTIDGRWKVANSTICTLALLGGGPCMPGPAQPSNRPRVGSPPPPNPTWWTRSPASVAPT